MRTITTAKKTNTEKAIKSFIMKRQDVCTFAFTFKS